MLSQSLLSTVWMLRCNLNSSANDLCLTALTVGVVVLLSSSRGLLFQCMRALTNKIRFAMAHCKEIRKEKHANLLVPRPSLPLKRQHGVRIPPCELLDHAHSEETPFAFLAYRPFRKLGRVIQMEVARLEKVRRRIHRLAGFWLTSTYLHCLGLDNQRINCKG